ncbi:MAG TPA: DUF2203 domain-containing protein [Sandaracinaceae bacterium LLY-WYZ-13_1]|nr:DUF2203 domain-containing protein [Sandaracinaceae bacterium LLY-WYZ-13_1]
MTRTFTLEEANRLVPRVAATLARTTQLIAQARAIARRLADAGVTAPQPGELPSPEDVDAVDEPELAADVARARMLAEAARDQARALTELGVVVRDLERGLVDFRSVVDGEREVWLCWQLGERDIRYFHDLHAGFPGRQPVEGHRFFRSRQLVPPRSSE